MSCAFLVWSAFFVLKCCRRKDPFSGGGRLARWVGYDVFCFSICIGIISYAIATQDVLEGTDLQMRDFHKATEMLVDHSLTPDGADYRLRQMLYWCQALYGVLSLPFVVFMAPAIDVMFTHASPTGYTRAG